MSSFLKKMGLKSIFLTCVIFSCALVIQGRSINPLVEDPFFLDDTEQQLSEELNATRLELYQQAVVTEKLAKKFVGAQLKENLFIVLRVLAEKELEETKRLDRQGRQDYDEDEDEGGSSGTTRRPNNIIPQVTNLIKQVFSGGGEGSPFPRINFTSYVESASRLFPKPIANQVLSFAKLVASNRENAKTTSTTKKPVVARTQTPTTTTGAPAPLIIVLPPQAQGGQAIVNGNINATEALNQLNNFNGTSANQNGQNSVWNIFIPNRASRPPRFPPTRATTKSSLIYTTRKRVATTLDEDDDDEDYYTDEDEDGARQLQILNTITSLLSSGIQGVATQASQASNAAKIEEALKAAEAQHQANLAAAATSNNNAAASAAAPAATNVATVPAGQTQIIITSSGAGTPVTSQVVPQAPTNVNANANANNIQAFNFQTFASAVRNNLGDIIRVMPDLFRGAREGFQLIQAVQTVISGFSSLADVVDI